MIIQNILTGLFLSAETQRFTADRDHAVVLDTVTAHIAAITFPNAIIIAV
jgi:hypothetical protein